ncbi:MAG TPA: 3-deoxy-7-phosphoheptulonate synthase, partial [Candidatus Nitrosotalea sp.]|nr:3-deoxy-7-phosphoheptulonate synthase [Candidatus Nitrosotalea sp.]
MQPTQNLHVRESVRLLPPKALKAELPMTERSNQTVVEGREAVKRILRTEDPRQLVIIGPCSIHDPAGALEYAEKLSRLREELADQLEIVMR